MPVLQLPWDAALMSFQTLLSPATQRRGKVKRVLLGEKLPHFN